MYRYDPYYFMLVIPAVLLALWAQYRVKSAYNQYSRVRSSRGFTGHDAARRILDQNGLHDVPVERVAGILSDHYDPRARVVRLSQEVYDSASIAAIGIAAHECGHAAQHAESYAPLKLRSAVIPVSNAVSKLALPLIIAGLVFGMHSLLWLYLLVFAATAFVQLITLPVEFNASSRALSIIEQNYILEEDEWRGAKKVLSAAALTYVAALAVSLAHLLRILLRTRSRR